jgi:teichuronic acid biosynthesis glycosyltransferase TuaG
MASPSHPLVSVITPGFNAAAYLEDTIASVQAQTFENWEMIIVDDHSRDATLEIAQKYAYADERVRAFALPEERKGAAHARNFGIEQARGRYIAFLDSDDLWTSQKLERQIEFMRRNGSAFSYSRYSLISKDGRNLGRVMPIPPQLTYRELLKTCPIGCLTAVYDTDVIGKQYMPDLPKGQDYALWLQILKIIPKADGIDEVLGFYRTGGASLSSNKLEKFKYIWRIYRNIEGHSLLNSSIMMIRFSLNYIYKNIN